MNQNFRALICLFTFSLLAALSNDAVALSSQKEARHDQHAKSPASATRAGSKRNAARPKGAAAKHAAAVRGKPAKSAPTIVAPAPIAIVPPLSGDAAAVKLAIDLARKGKTGEATGIEKSIGDPSAQKLVEWLILRYSSGDVGFGRYAAFIADNPNWPSIPLLRRRAEGRLWEERSDPATVRRFTGGQPLSGKGRFALARVLLGDGDRDAAIALVRAAWRSQELSESAETEAVNAFGDLLTRDDHRARMDKRIGAKDFAGATRAARRLGGDDPSIVKACIAVAANATKTDVLLDAVPSEARQDLGYTLCRIHWLMRHDRFAEATRLMLASPAETMAFQDTDEWWRERRVLARKLLDLGEFQSAYQVVRDAVLPANENYRAEFHFMTGWIALRYLDDPATARTHFAHIDDGSVNPIVLARANYWRGRAAEAAGDNEEMRADYEAAARHGTAYYGQLARGKLGLDRIELRPPPPPSEPVEPEPLRAAEMLYTLGERDVVLKFVSISRSRALTSPCWRRWASLPHARTMRLPCCKLERPRSPAAWHWTFMPSPISACRSIVRSVPKWSAASSIRWSEPKVRLTSATHRRRKQLV